MAEEGEAEEAEGDAGVAVDFGTEVAASEEADDAFTAGAAAFEPAVVRLGGVGGGKGEPIVEEVGAVDGAEAMAAMFGVGGAVVFAVVAVGDVVGKAMLGEVFGEFAVPGGVAIGGLGVEIGEGEEGLGGWGGEDVGDGGGGEALGVALGGDAVELGGAGVEPSDAEVGAVDRAGDGGLAEVLDGDEVGFDDQGGAIGGGDLLPDAVVVEEAAVAGGVGCHRRGGNLAGDLGGKTLGVEVGFELGGGFAVGDDVDGGEAIDELEHGC
ncbi:MAG: hypothetical protein RLZZ511_3750 [Cyanobacteriota bacterium]